MAFNTFFSRSWDVFWLGGTSLQLVQGPLLRALCNPNLLKTGPEQCLRTMYTCSCRCISRHAKLCVTTTAASRLPCCSTACCTIMNPRLPALVIPPCMLSTALHMHPQLFACEGQPPFFLLSLCRTEANHPLQLCADVCWPAVKAAHLPAEAATFTAKFVAHDPANRYSNPGRHPSQCICCQARRGQQSGSALLCVAACSIL